MQSLLVKSTLVGTTSAERCSAALQDAASANMRLTTWLDVLQPSILARLCLLVIQVIMSTICILSLSAEFQPAACEEKLCIKGHAVVAHVSACKASQ